MHVFMRQTINRSLLRLDAPRLTNNNIQCCKLHSLWFDVSLTLPTISFTFPVFLSIVGSEIIKKGEKSMNETAVVETVQTVADTATQPAQQGSWGGLLLYCLIVFAVIYLFMVRPNKKRMAEYQKMVDGIQVGNRILAAGIYGTVKKVGEKTIEMEIAKGVVIEVSKNAVASVEAK